MFDDESEAELEKRGVDLANAGRSEGGEVLER